MCLSLDVAIVVLARSTTSSMQLYVYIAGESEQK